MLKLVVLTAALFWCYVSTVDANGLKKKGSSHGEDHGGGFTLPTSLPTPPGDLSDGARQAVNATVGNLSSLLFDGQCNITACNPVRYKHCYQDKIPQLIVHAIAVVLGAVLAFFGYRLFKYTLFATGALIGGIIAFYITYNYLSNEHHVFYISIGVAIVFGALCGVLAVVLYYVGIFIAGAALGGIAAWFILSLLNIDYFVEHRWVPILIMLAIAVTFGLAALYAQKWLVLLSTPVIGSLLITAGIDYFLELGRMMQYAFNVMSHVSDKPECWYSWAMLGVLGALILAGLIVQVFVTGRKYDHKKDTNGWFCFGKCNNKKSADSEMEMKMKTISASRR